MEERASNLKILIWFALFAAVITAWHWIFPSATCRYKMTVQVETPEGIKTGSAVRELNLHSHLNIGGNSGGAIVGLADFSGEAVVVDLGSRGKLFALLRGGIEGGDYAWNIFFRSFPSGGLNPDGIRWYGDHHSSGKIVLEPSSYPDMVMFTDPNDVNTSELAYSDKHIYQNITQEFKDEVTDNMEKLFGKGVKVKEVSIEISGEPVTTGIQKYLPKFDASHHAVSPSNFMIGE